MKFLGVAKGAQVNLLSQDYYIWYIWSEVKVSPLFGKGYKYKNRWREHVFCIGKDSIPKTAYFDGPQSRT